MKLVDFTVTVGLLCGIVSAFDTGKILQINSSFIYFFREPAIGMQVAFIHQDKFSLLNNGFNSEVTCI